MATTMKEMREHGLFEDAKEKYENTSKSWKSRWWNVICDIWNNFTHWQEKYDLDLIAKTIIKKVKKRVRKATSRARNYGAEVIEKIPISFAKGTKLCYLFKFYDSDKNLLFSKVGTTERTIQQRLKEEIEYYKKHSWDIALATIESVFDTGDVEPEGAQDYAKGHYIQKFKKNYIRNDRFTCDIDVEDFNTLISGYLAG